MSPLHWFIQKRWLLKVSGWKDLIVELLVDALKVISGARAVRLEYQRKPTTKDGE